MRSRSTVVYGEIVGGGMRVWGRGAKEKTKTMLLGNEGSIYVGNGVRDRARFYFPHGVTNGDHTEPYEISNLFSC